MPSWFVFATMVLAYFCGFMTGRFAEQDKEAESKADDIEFTGVGFNRTETLWRVFVFADTHWPESEKDEIFREIYDELRYAMMEVE
jgi:hypothetical protein